MGDVSSGMASAIIQIYLKEILNCFLHREYLVRFWAMRVIEIVLRQGLIHPIKIVPFLICLSTDPEKEVKTLLNANFPFTLMCELAKKINNESCAILKYVLFHTVNQYVLVE